MTTHTHSCNHGDLAHHHGGGRDAICLDDVSFQYDADDREPVLRDVTLHVEQGCNLGIIGPNGAGKTTLVKIILGQLEPSAGSVRVMDMTPAKACRQGDVIGYVPQRIEAEWRFPITAEQVVMMGLVGKTGLFKRHSKPDREHALRVMEQVGVIDLRRRPIGALSGGQQQRLFIARALAANPKLLILDEPLVGVDEAGQQQFASLIHDLHESFGLTVVIVSHDIQAIAAGCNRVACLRQSIHFHDAPDGLTRDVLQEVFAHEIATVLPQ